MSMTINTAANTEENSQTNTPERPELPAGAVWQDDGSVYYSLSSPVEIADRHLAEVTLRPLTAGDLMDSMDRNGRAATSLFLIKRSAGLNDIVSDKLIRSMTARDFVTINEIISVFTQAGRKIG